MLLSLSLSFLQAELLKIRLPYPSNIFFPCLLQIKGQPGTIVTLFCQETCLSVTLLTQVNSSEFPNLILAGIPIITQKW